MLGPDPSSNPFVYSQFNEPNVLPQGCVIAWSLFRTATGPILQEFINDMNTLLEVPL